MGTLDGRVAIVTGGSGDLGRRCALALSAAGASIIVADIDKTRLVVTEIHDHGGQATGVHCDVSETDSAVAMATAALDTYGRIDILVNNAAVLPAVDRVGFEQISEADWDRAMAVNVKGMWQSARVVVPTMRRAGHGKVINIGADADWAQETGFLHLTTSKAAIPELTRALARELVDTGIDVNMIEPGPRGSWGADFDRALSLLASTDSDGTSGTIVAPSPHR